MPPEAEQILHTCPNCAALLDVSEQEPFSEINCPSCAAQMRVRKQFDSFELTEAIASGGMGTVYKARDVNLNRIVALKLLRKEFSTDEEYIEKLETEAKITASVNHPFVVKVFSFGCDQGLYYIAMELVDKGSLDDLMNLQGRIAEVQVLEIGVQVAQGLRAAYQAGLIHRDVKPGNILFADAHTAKIVDFGLAMPLEQATDANEEIWGTPYYVAPEKLNHEPEDFRSDIYSLGGTLFHALAGRPPFEAENASLVALKHLKNQAVSLQAFAPDISSPTAYVINRTLAKDPDERYQSYDELIEHLEYARAQLQENSGKPRQPKARVELEGEDQQQVLGYITMGVIAFVVILGIVLFLFRDSIKTRRESVSELETRQVQMANGGAEQVLVDLRKQLVNGQSANALDGLKQLEEKPNLVQPLKNWVLLHEGIAAFLSDSSWDGQAAFQRLHRNGLYSSKPEDSKLGNFFPDVAWLASGSSTIHVSVARDYATNDFKPIALFAFALKEWESGRFEASDELFNAFLGSSPKDKWQWIEDFKPLAKRYTDDFVSYKELSERIKDADTQEKRTATLPVIAAVKAKLHVPGRLPDELDAVERAFRNNEPNIAITSVPPFEPPSPPHDQVTLEELRTVAVPLMHNFRGDEARGYLKDAVVSSADRRPTEILANAAGDLGRFKRMLGALIDQKNPIKGRVALRHGSPVVGILLKPGKDDFQVTTLTGVVHVPWTEMMPENILWMGESRASDAKIIERIHEDEWLISSGIYLMLNNHPSQALERWNKAVQLMPKLSGYVADLKTALSR